jgi:hypothetical protein
VFSDRLPMHNHGDEVPLEVHPRDRQVKSLQKKFVPGSLPEVFRTMNVAIPMVSPSLFKSEPGRRRFRS